MSNLLSHIKKCGFSNEGFTWDNKALKKMIQSEIFLTNENLTIKPKKSKSEIIIPINQIYTIKYHNKDMGFKAKLQIEIILKDKSSICLYFSGIKSVVSSGSFMSELSQLVEMPKQQKLLDTMEKFFIEIPPGTNLSELKALKCPSCQAPLELMPPCKCEHCGVMIDLKK